MDRRGLWAAVALLVTALSACGDGETERTSRAITLGRLGLQTLEAGEPNWHLVLNDNTTLLDQYACAPGLNCTLSAGQEIDARIGHLRPQYEAAGCLGLDCDAAGEIGRLCYDDALDALRCCSGAGGWVDCGAGGGGGSGDITSVGSCLTGACFQSEASRFFLAAPYGGGQMTPRAIEDADLPASIARDTEITSSTCLNKDLDANCEVGSDPPPGTGLVSIDPDDDGVAECTIDGSSLISCTAHPTQGGYLQLREGAEDGGASVTLQVQNDGLNNPGVIWTTDAEGRFPAGMIATPAFNRCAQFDGTGGLQAAEQPCETLGPSVRWFAPFGMPSLEETLPGTDDDCTCWLWNIPYRIAGANTLAYAVTTADANAQGQFGVYSIAGSTATRRGWTTREVSTAGLKEKAFQQVPDIIPGEYLLCECQNDATPTARLRAAGEGATQFCGHFTTAASGGTGYAPGSITIPSPLPQNATCKPPAFWVSTSPNGTP